MLADVFLASRERVSFGERLLDGRANIAAALLDVPLHCLSNTDAIAIGDPLEDLQVLIASALQAIALFEIDHAEDKDPLVDAAQMIQEHSVARGFRESLMEPSVQLGKFLA